MPIALLLATAARGIGVDGASCGKSIHRSEPLTQGSRSASSARLCTDEPAGSGREDGPHCAAEDDDGSGSPSRGCVTCARRR